MGRIRRPHGVRGELFVELMTGYPERLVPGRQVYLGDELVPAEVVAARRHKDGALLTLKGYDDRNAAEMLRDRLIQIRVEDAVPLEEGEFYHHQVVGLEVVTEDGQSLGRVTQVLETGANDVYVVVGVRGELLLPAIDDVVRHIDVDAGQMQVALPPGLLEDE